MVRIRESVHGVKQGDVRGSRTVIGMPFSLGVDNRWGVVCQCKCGKISVVRTSNLVSGQTQCNSCKCADHGHSKTTLYIIWSGMLHRCYSENDKRYDRYGARGITVCEEWLRAFGEFEAWAMSSGYANGLQIDRRNNDVGYCPGNCRWVTPTVNANNRSSNRRLEVFGESKSLADWARDGRCAVAYGTLRNRIHEGWNPQDAITTPKLK